MYVYNRHIGISGNAYAFVSLWRTLQDPMWLQRAKLFAIFALDNLPLLCEVPDHPFSLYEGQGGLASLLYTLDSPNSSLAAFPGYEIF